MTNSDENQERIEAIEQKIKFLVTLGITQTILLAVVLPKNGSNKDIS